MCRHWFNDTVAWTLEVDVLFTLWKKGIGSSLNCSTDYSTHSKERRRNRRRNLQGRIQTRPNTRRKSLLEDQKADMAA